MKRPWPVCSSSALAVSVALAWQSPARAEGPNPASALPAATVDSAAGGAPAAPADSRPVPPVPLVDVLEGQAKEDYEAGRLLYDSGDYTSALLKFQSAYAEAGDPRLLWNAAGCEQNLRHYVKASALVRQFMASHSPLVTSEAASRAQAFLDAALPLTAPLEVESNEPNAEVYLDHELLGSTRPTFAARIDLGKHQIVVTKRGFQPFAETLTVATSAKVHVTATLRSSAIAGPIFPAQPPPGPAPYRGSAVPTWAWIAGAGLVLTGIATAS